ncbi:hypothetical protein BGY98DRAFT_995219 [Russula aff. rugulosa BPL654]|nr:hypothetical protein BGY98DRAFT_995219 [Russula aff. rugulosa BPL654]
MCLLHSTVIGKCCCVLRVAFPSGSHLPSLPSPASYSHTHTSESPLACHMLAAYGTHIAYVITFTSSALGRPLPLHPTWQRYELSSDRNGRRVCVRWTLRQFGDCPRLVSLVCTAMFVISTTWIPGGSIEQDECHPDQPFTQKISTTYLVVVGDYRGNHVSKAVAIERLVDALSGCQQSDHERQTMSRTRSPLHSDCTSIGSTSPTGSENKRRRKVPLPVLERITTDTRKYLRDRNSCHSTEKLHGPRTRRRKVAQTAQLFASYCTYSRMPGMNNSSTTHRRRHARKSCAFGTPRSRSPYFSVTHFLANLWRD